MKFWLYDDIFLEKAVKQNPQNEQNGSKYPIMDKKWFLTSSKGNSIWESIYYGSKIWNQESRILSSDKKDIRITNHVYQPKHEILSKKDAEEVLKKYNTKPSQLPYILINDKGLEDLDVRPGDIIKITRTSFTAGESVYYRYVVED